MEVLLSTEKPKKDWRSADKVGYSRTKSQYYCWSPEECQILAAGMEKYGDLKPGHRVGILHKLIPSKTMAQIDRKIMIAAMR